MNWKSKRVLIGGGAGMIGSHLTRELLNRGAYVTVADNLSSGSIKNLKGIQNDIEFKKYDLRNYGNCKRVCKGKDVAFGLQATMGGIAFITKYAAKIMFDNSFMNMNMLLASRDCEVGKYFYSSSACVYPNYKQQDSNVTPLKESDSVPADPNEWYGWEKLYAEKLVEGCIRDWGMDIRVARFHNIFGEMFTCFDKEKGKAPCHLLLKAIKHPNPPFDIWGKGDATRSFLYVDDCIEAILRLMDSDYKQPINIGSDRLISVDELANVIIKISGKDIVPTHDLSKPEGVKGRNADLTLVKQVLKWQPKISLEEGLKRTYEWAVNHYSELEGI
jgi:nucleoside-diphosphate-sugar epimerase